MRNIIPNKLNWIARPIQYILDKIMSNEDNGFVYRYNSRLLFLDKVEDTIDNIVIYFIIFKYCIDNNIKYKYIDLTYSLLSEELDHKINGSKLLLSYGYGEKYVNYILLKEIDIATIDNKKTTMDYAFMRALDSLYINSENAIDYFHFKESCNKYFNDFLCSLDDLKKILLNDKELYSTDYIKKYINKDYKE